MSPSVPPDEQPAGAVPPADDTAAFQRFYQEDATADAHGLLYRLLVGWWRRD